MRKYLLLWGLLLGCIPTLLAQEAIIVRGRVTDTQGNPLLGVSVILEGTTKGASTNEKGLYEIHRVPVGEQTFVFSSMGYQTVKQVFEVTLNPSGTHTHLNVSLQEEAQQLQEVEIIGRRESSYKNTSSFSGTKTATAIRDIPQTINYVTKEVILDQGASTVNDVVKNISGVSQYTTYNDFSIRGFRTTGNRNSGNLLNGMRAQTSLWSASSLANIERVEVIKGPAAALFGNAAPGGIINRVTKKPLLQRQHTVSVNTGSWGTLKTYGDFTGPLNESKSLLYRLNLGYETTDGYRDLQGRNTLTIAPSFSFIPNEKTRFNVDITYYRLDGKVDRGQTIFGDADLYSVPITRSLSATNDFLRETQMNISLGLTHKITDNLSFNSTYLNSSYSEDLREHNQANSYYMQQQGKANTGDPTKILMQALLRQRTFRNNSFNNYFNYNFTTGLVKHTLLVGYDYFQVELLPGASQLTAGGYLLKNGKTTTTFNPARLNTYVVDANNNPVTNVAVFDLNKPTTGNVMKETGKYIFTSGNTKPTLQTSHGVYLQEQLEVSIVKLLLGLRKEFFMDYINYKENNEEKIEQQALIPRVGLVITANDNINFYSTWMKGFEPQTAAIQSDPDRYGGPFDPVYSELYEMGVKTDWFNNRLSATASVFKIIQQNSLYDAFPAVIGKPDLKMQIGEEESNGFEFDLAGEITPNWSILANYAYIDARITKTAQNNEKDFDMQRPSTPRHSGNIWTKYIITEGPLKHLGFGAGYNFVTERYGQVGRRTNTTVYPGYGLVNAVLYYKINQIQLQLNLNNVLNQTHWVGGYDKLRSFPGAPRNINASVTYKF
ncbi:TonB-dependent receptor [Capnocytophaga gingivalis]|uniref:TonB-dependent receptor n=1 Tax=Capnocytophaga gingivalis TaxID=1017 RepID=A0ABU5Z7I0_9FLAO|nr:TonB-dependent receptor [Capnocytophaga gingivalis]MEB3073707.1 TonB-dependent receptor [Capnocytophaga gingivalis]